jgi:hypothetical protein
MVAAKSLSGRLANGCGLAVDALHGLRDARPGGRTGSPALNAGSGSRRAGG